MEEIAHAQVARQAAVALADPCFHAERCSQEKFFWLMKQDSVVLCCGLTVNIGME